MVARFTDIEILRREYDFNPRNRPMDVLQGREMTVIDLEEDADHWRDGADCLSDQLAQFQRGLNGRASRMELNLGDLIWIEEAYYVVRDHVEVIFPWNEEVPMTLWVYFS